MSFSYTRSQLVARINAGIQGRKGILVDINETANDAVREVSSQVDIASTIRYFALPPTLFRNQYEYPAPSDLKGNDIIDIPAQTKRQDGQWFMVSPEEFDRTKGWSKGMVALDNYDGLLTLRIASDGSEVAITPSTLDSLSAGGGTWTVVGDVSSVAVDLADYLCGVGSLAGTIGTGATGSAGIKNSTLNSFDITNYMQGDGSLFVYAKIQSTTGVSGFTLQIGSSTGNYYSFTVTSQVNTGAFVNGWNLLRFDISTTGTKVGTPVLTATNFISIAMNSSPAVVSQVVKFDSIKIRRGKYYRVRYYSRFGWQSSTGTWKENSTDDSDIVVADSNEYALMIHMGKMKAMEELKEWDVLKNLTVQWEGKDGRGGMKGEYMQDNPSQAMIWTDEYYSYRDNRNDYNYDNNGNSNLRL